MKLFEHLKTTEFTSIFYSWKLHFASKNSFSEQIALFESSIMIIDFQDKKFHEEYELFDIINCRKTIKDLHYKITYINNWDQWNANSSWQSISNFENAKDYIDYFHRQNSQKSKSTKNFAITWQMNFINAESRKSRAWQKKKIRHES